MHVKAQELHPRRDVGGDATEAFDVSLHITLALAREAGAPVAAADLDCYQRSCNTQRRLIETLAAGISRKSRNVTPTIDQYLRAKADGTGNGPDTADRTTAKAATIPDATKAAGGASDASGKGDE